jgi:hypothetical protein
MVTGARERIQVVAHLIWLQLFVVVKSPSLAKSSTLTCRDKVQH